MYFGWLGLFNSVELSARPARASGLRYDLPDCAHDSSYDRIHLGLWEPFTKGSSLEEVTVDGGDFLAEDDALAIQACGSCRQRNPGRTEPAAGEQRHDNQIVGHPVAHVVGDDQRGPRLVRIVGLPRGQNQPYFTPSRHRKARGASALHPRLKVRMAAARRVDRQNSRSELGPGDSKYWETIASSC